MSSQFCFRASCDNRSCVPCISLPSFKATLRWSASIYFNPFVSMTWILHNADETCAVGSKVWGRLTVRDSNETCAGGGGSTACWRVSNETCARGGRGPVGGSLCEFQMKLAQWGVLNADGRSLWRFLQVISETVATQLLKTRLLLSVMGLMQPSSYD